MTPEELAQLIRSALVGAVRDQQIALDPEDVPTDIVVERPRVREHGDWSTNIAMRLGKKAGTNPRALAELTARFPFNL